MAEVTQDYAFVGSDGGFRSHNSGLAAGAKAYADVAAENSADNRAETPQNHLISGLGVNAGFNYLGQKIFDTDRDVLRTSAQTRVEAKENTQLILNAIAASDLRNSERESRELRDALAAQTAANALAANNAALINQIGGMMNTAISTISNVVNRGNGDVSVSL